MKPKSEPETISSSLLMSLRREFRLKLHQETGPWCTEDVPTSRPTIQQVIAIMLRLTSDVSDRQPPPHQPYIHIPFISEIRAIAKNSLNELASPKAGLVRTPPPPRVLKPQNQTKPIQVQAFSMDTTCLSALNNVHLQKVIHEPM